MNDMTPTPPLRLWLVRHGKTLFNELGLAQGWSDSPLTPDGIEGVQRLAVELAHIPWVAVYSSTSERAMDTAEILTQDSALAIVRDRRWKEYNFGILEARPNEELFSAMLAGIAEGDPRPHLARLFRGDFPALERGETGAEYVARVSAAVADIRDAHQTGDVLVVTHGMTVGVAATIFDPDHEFGGMENATFTLIEIDDHGGRLIAVGAASPEGIIIER